MEQNNYSQLSKKEFNNLKKILRNETGEKRITKDFDFKSNLEKILNEKTIDEIKSLGLTEQHFNAYELNESFKKKEIFQKVRSLPQYKNSTDEQIAEEIKKGAEQLRQNVYNKNFLGLSRDEFAAVGEDGVIVLEKAKSYNTENKKDEIVKGKDSISTKNLSKKVEVIYDDLEKKRIQQGREAYERATERVIEEQDPEAQARRRNMNKLAEAAREGKTGEVAVELAGGSTPEDIDINKDDLKAKGKYRKYGKSAIGIAAMLTIGAAVNGLMMGSNKGRLNNSQLYGQQPYSPY